MPSTSPAQHKLMEIAAHTPGGYDGVPQDVGKEFAAADSGDFKEAEHPRDEDGKFSNGSGGSGSKNAENFITHNLATNKAHPFVSTFMKECKTIGAMKARIKTQATEKLKTALSLIEKSGDIASDSKLVKDLIDEEIKLREVDAKSDAATDVDKLNSFTISDSAAADSQPRAAGIMFLSPQGETLLLRRGAGGDYAGHFGLPGGHIEDGESAEDAARRETLEETGFDYSGTLEKLHCYGQFATFIARDVSKFDVKLCDESTGFVWTMPDSAPSPIHPGLTNAFRVAGARTEFDVAQLMVDGILPSPQFYSNITLLAIRITGTGMAYRSKDQEYVWRDPSIYLNDNFLKRCQGLPVIMDHPEEGNGPAMSSKEYTKRNIGSIMLPYIKGEDVWGIARCHVDAAIAKIIADPENTSTSPNVVFNDSSGNMLVKVEGEDPLLIEGQPFLIDHIAIVTSEQGGRGVWDKGGAANGVLLTNNEVSEMSDPAKEGAKADAQIQNTAPDFAALLSAVNGVATIVTGLSSRMDSMEKNMPAKELKSAADSDEALKADKAKKDAEEEEKAKKDAEAKEEEEKAKADAAKKDENLTEKEMEDKAKKDADDEMAMADAQAKADSAYACFGKSASRALSGETLLNYRKRLMRGLQNYSDDCKNVNLNDVKDLTTLNMLEAKIFADAFKHATSPKAYADGQLQAVRTQATDGSGRTITKYYGDINSWLGQFKSSPYIATEFHTANNAKR